MWWLQTWTGNHLTICLGDSVVKNLPANAGDSGNEGSIPGLGRIPGGGNGTPLHYSCLENPMDRGTWWATVQGVAMSQRPQSNWAHSTRLTLRVQHLSVLKGAAMKIFSSGSGLFWKYFKNLKNIGVMRRGSMTKPSLYQEGLFWALED